MSIDTVSPTTILAAKPSGGALLKPITEKIHNYGGPTLSKPVYWEPVNFPIL